MIKCCQIWTINSWIIINKKVKSVDHLLLVIKSWWWECWWSQLLVNSWQFTVHFWPPTPNDQVLSNLDHQHLDYNRQKSQIRWPSTIDDPMLMDLDYQLSSVDSPNLDGVDFDGSQLLVSSWQSTFDHQLLMTKCWQIWTINRSIMFDKKVELGEKNSKQFCKVPNAKKKHHRWNLEKLYQLCLKYQSVPSILSEFQSKDTRNENYFLIRIISSWQNHNKFCLNFLWNEYH